LSPELSKLMLVSRAVEGAGPLLSTEVSRRAGSPAFHYVGPDLPLSTLGAGVDILRNDKVDFWG